MKDYAKFLKENYLKTLALEQLKLSKEYDISLMQFYKHLSNEQMFKLTMKKVNEFLTSLIDGTSIEKAKRSIRKWEVDEFPGFSKKDVPSPSDLVLVHHIQKKALLMFLPKYTKDIKERVKIISELDEYYSNVQNMAVSTLIKIQKESGNEILNKKKELEGISKETETETFSYSMSYNLRASLLG